MLLNAEPSLQSFIGYYDIVFVVVLFETGSHSGCLGIYSIDQAGLEFTEIHLHLPLGAEIKDMHPHAWLKFESI